MDEFAQDAQAVAPDIASFVCAKCGGDFTVDDVWDSDGQVICKSCYSKSTSPSSTTQPTEGPKSAASNRPGHSSPRRGNVLPQITCPHCWHHFLAEDILWVSQHAELMGDTILGPDAASRFLPTRFTINGDALDARGLKSQILACPHCHLTIPRVWIEVAPLFVSIVGVPSSGKSYFLTTMTWELRHVLPSQFAVAFSDADAAANRILNGYEELLFLQDDPARMVAIRKTEVHGVGLYDQIRFGQQITSLPRPFLFSLGPAASHPNISRVDKLSRILCLYDNAGEAFDPGEDSSSSPVTQHLAKSRVLMFLYDPTQDPRVRARCRTVSNDPQLDGRPRRQETVLSETITRIRRYTGLTAHQKHERPIIVIVPKADIWGPLIQLDLDTEPTAPHAIAGGNLAGVDVARIEAVSADVRSMLLQYAPEFVASLEEFCAHVVYIPASALGRAPEQQDGQEGLYIRASEIRPKWVTVPFLYMCAKWATGLIGGVPSAAASTSAASAPATPQ